MLMLLSDELREQRARLLARAAPLEADVGALLSATVDAVPPAGAGKEACALLVKLVT